MKTRNSNIELLRVIAMLMVMLLHANYAAVGFPRPALVQSEPLLWLSRMLAENIAIPAVNVFVLITGWFGTHFKWKSLGSLAFQVVFISSLITLGAHLYPGHAPVPLKQLHQALTGYWFVNSFIVLYLFSPVLNAYVEQSTEPTFRRLLLPLLIIFMTVGNFVEEYNMGYSALHFFLIYLLGRYLRLHLAPRLERYPRRHFLMLFIASVGLLTGITFLIYYYRLPFHLASLINYNNPLVILSAVALLLYCSRLQFTSRCVNWLGAGSFTAYLVHQQMFVRKDYYAFFRQLHTDCSPELLPIVLPLTLLGLFILFVLIDQLRQLAWQLLCRLIPSKS